MYNNLKLPNSHDGNGVLSSHINAHQSAYPDSTSHLLHTTQATSSSATASAQLATGDAAHLPTSYHSNYTFRAAEPVASVSSSETEYAINSNVVTSNQGNAAVATTSVLASSTTGLHQRRGSLQLWQFLVALLDEPAAR